MRAKIINNEDNLINLKRSNYQHSSRPKVKDNFIQSEQINKKEKQVEHSGDKTALWKVNAYFTNMEATGV